MDIDYAEIASIFIYSLGFQESDSWNDVAKEIGDKCQVIDMMLGRFSKNLDSYQVIAAVTLLHLMGKGYIG